MIRKFLVLVLLAAPVAALDMPTGSVSYLGYFKAPTGQTWMQGGLSYITGCMGETDPSPSDGYAGCLFAIAKAESYPDPSRFFVMDIVPPTSTGTNRATQVVANYTPTDGELLLSGQFDGYLETTFDIHVVESGGVCQRIHAVYADHYTGDTIPGATTHYTVDCDTSTPTVTSYDNIEINPSPPGNVSYDQFHPHKWSKSMGAIPSGLQSLFGGYGEFYAGGNKVDGTRGRSAGPSVAVRQETAWSTYGDDVDIKPLVYYYTGTESTYQGYTKWYIPTQFQFPSDNADLGIRVSGFGSQFILDGSYSAYVQMVRTPKYCSTCYPANDANAGPTFCTNCTVTEDPYGGGGADEYTEKYRDYPAKYPDPDSHPVQYYASNYFDCDGQSNKLAQFPSFHDYIGSPANQYSPMDCKLLSENVGKICPDGTGPQGINYHSVMLFYSTADLADAYTDTQAPYEILPYDELDITPDLSNDGYNSEDYCIGAPGGSAYDETNQLLYVVYSKAGGDAIIQVYEIDAPDGLPEETESQSKVDGASAAGAKVGG